MSEFKIEHRTSHPFCMYEEIMATPSILKKLLSKRVLDESERIAEKILEKGIKRIYLTECATSYYAGFASSYVFNEVPKISSSPLPSFEIINYPPPDINEKTAVFVISHRGRTKIALEIVESLRPKKPYIIGVTDVEGSPLTKVVDDVSMGTGGEERSFPKTRSWLGTILRISLIALMVAKNKGVNIDKLFNQLKNVPKMASDILSSTEEKVKDLAKKYNNKKFYIIGGGPNWATAQEGALKLKEASLVESEAIEIEEIAHGHQLALGKNSVVVAIAPPGRSYLRSVDIVHALNIMGFQSVAIVRKDDSLSKTSTDSIELKENLNELFTPMMYIIPIQLLAYYIALNKKLNPDENLRLPKFREAHKFLFPP